MTESLNILVVDDEEMIRGFLKEYLETTTPHRVFTSCDGVEAFEVITGQKIDCCITDLTMPRMDGIALTEKIQAFNNTIPVVVLSGYPSMENLLTTIKNGVVEFLVKPIKMDQVRFVIDRVMKQRELFVENLLLKEEVKGKEKIQQLNQELQEKILELKTINLIQQELDQGTSSRDIFQTLVRLSGEITHCLEAHVCMIDQETKTALTIASSFKGGVEKETDKKWINDEVIHRVAEDGIPFFIKSSNGNGHIIAMPLKIRSKVFGILALAAGNGKRQFNEKDLYYLHFLVEKASFIIENLALYENIYENLFSTLYALVETLEARDTYTKQHSSRVTKYAVAIADAIGCNQEELEVLQVAGNLHDIGKIGIPDNILLKPGKLLDEEYEVIKRHPLIGSNIIGHLNVWIEEQRIIKHHHERWDGRGYPENLFKEDIPLLSRIIAVADTYDALTSDRSYRRKLPEDKAVTIIEENAGTQFDPHVATVFLKLFKKGIFS